MPEPLYRHRPPHRWTYGNIACKVGADLGLPPDDEQQWLLDTIYAEKAHDRPAAFEVAAISGRQQIKTSTFGIAALTDLFVFGVEKHLWTAHHGKTLQDTFGDFRRWLKSNHEYEDQVQFYEGHQDLSIVRTDPETGVESAITFASRSGRGGRGVTGVKRITIDEALYLEPKHVGAIYPTTITQPSAQIRIASSAGLLTSAELRRIRNRGRSGKDARIAYVEYGAERRPCADPHCSHVHEVAQGCALDDRELWWQACCALWSGRILEDAIENLRGSMPAEEFMREMFSWWEDPVSEGGALPIGEWLALADITAPREHPLVFGIDVTEERLAWIAVVWRRTDGAAHVVLTNKGRPVPAHNLVAECARLAQLYGGSVVSPPAFVDELERAGVDVKPLTTGEFAAGCGALADAITGRTVRHGNQLKMNDAIRAARWRNAGGQGERAFQLKDCPEIGPAAAAVRALRGLDQHAEFSLFGAGLDDCDSCGQPAGDHAADRGYLCEACWAEKEG